jgi:hypothetical protein
VSRAWTQVTWHASLDAVPLHHSADSLPPAAPARHHAAQGSTAAPAVYIAHEFLDALPVHQFVRDAQRGWLEVTARRGRTPLHTHTRARALAVLTRGPVSHYARGRVCDGRCWLLPLLAHARAGHGGHS